MSFAPHCVESLTGADAGKCLIFRIKSTDTMGSISENSLVRITHLVAFIRQQRRRLAVIRDIHCRYRAELLEYAERHDDEYRHMISQQTRLLDNAAMPVSKSLVWKCLSHYLHSVASQTPKPLCDTGDAEYIELLAQIGRCHDSEQLCSDWIRHYEDSLRDALKQ